MIICPSCKIDLKKRRGSFFCPKCNFKVQQKDNILIFNPKVPSNLKGFDAKYLDDFFRHEQENFWFVARKKVILDTFKKFVLKKESILEIGAGTGDVARFLKKTGFKNMSVGEIHLAGLKYAQKYGIKDLFQFDINKSPFKNHFDVIGMFDVIEHLDNDNLALKNIHQMLKENGKVIITVPAMKWLWSDIDRQSGHLRRYDKNTIQKLLNKNSFKIVSIRGYFILILPFLILRSLLNRCRSERKWEDRTGVKINRFSNLILLAIMATERLILKKASGNLAGSLIIVAQKK